MKKPFYVSLKPYLNHALLSRPTSWPTIFANPYPLEVEIGFGNGEYLAKICALNPTTNFLGFEQYCERIHRTLRKLSRVPSEQVRVLRLDAKAGFERYIAPRSITKVHCLYPPPWPKKSDAKHRLFTHEFLKTINNRLVDGGVFLLVTDWKPYTEWILEQIPGAGFALTFNHIRPHYNTKFENKWVEGGQQEFYEMVLTKVEHQEMPVKEDVQMQTYLVDAFDPDNFVLGEITEGHATVALKDIMFDPKRQIAMVYAVVSDEGVAQHVRFVIAHTPKGWRVQLAQGALLMPTQAVALALSYISAQAKATVA